MPGSGFEERCGEAGILLPAVDLPHATKKGEVWSEDIEGAVAQVDNFLGEP